MDIFNLTKEAVTLKLHLENGASGTAKSGIQKRWECRICKVSCTQCNRWYKGSKEKRKASVERDKDGNLRVVLRSEQQKMHKGQGQSIYSQPYCQIPIFQKRTWIASRSEIELSECSRCPRKNLWTGIFRTKSYEVFEIFRSIILSFIVRMWWWSDLYVFQRHVKRIVICLGGIGDCWSSQHSPCTATTLADT